MNDTTAATAPVPPTGFDPVAAIETGPLAYNIYREVHKGLRLALFDATVAVGSADHGDPVARLGVVRTVSRLVAVLHAHHAHEDTHIRPVLERVDLRLTAQTDAGHAE